MNQLNMQRTTQTATNLSNKAPKFPSDDLNANIRTAIESNSFAIEKAFDEILDGMEKSGMITIKIRKIVQDRITEDIYTATITELVSSFSDTDKKNLINAMHTGLNDYQKLMLYLKLYKNKKGRDIEEFATTKYEQALKQFINEYYIMKSSIEDVSKLTDDQCVIIESLIDDGKWAEALAKVDTSKNPATSTSSINQNNQELTNVIELLKSGKYTEAKGLIDRIATGVSTK